MFKVFRHIRVRYIESLNLSFLRSTVLAKKLKPFLVGKVLDVGCGSGLILKKADIKGVGCDKYKPQKVHIPFILFDGVNLPFAGKSFDTVLLCDVLHHSGDEILKECLRVGKRIIIKDHFWENKKDIFWLKLFDRLANDPKYVNCNCRYKTLQEWKEIGKIKHTWSYIVKHIIVEASSL